MTTMFKHQFQLAVQIHKFRGRNPCIGVTFRVVVPEVGTTHVYSNMSGKVEPLPDVKATSESVLKAIQTTFEGRTSSAHLSMSVPSAGYSSPEYRNIITSSLAIFQVKNQMNKMKEAKAFAEELVRVVSEACAGSGLEFNHKVEVT